MTNADTTTLDADRAEFADLMVLAECGRLVPSTSARLEVLRHRIATAEGVLSGEELAAAANQLREQGHR